MTSRTQPVERRDGDRNSLPDRSGFLGALAHWCACSVVTICVHGLVGCASGPSREPAPGLTPMEARALIGRAMPPNVPDRNGWATDIYAALATLQIAPTPQAVCAVVAVTEQESTFRTNPPVPGLAAIAWREIDGKADRAGIPRLVVHTALKLTSPDGKSYSDRIDAATTERDLSRIFDDIVGTLPLGERLLGKWNPVRTAGPMQVSIRYAENHAHDKTYPYPMTGSIRDEVFTRRGGLYFGIAHLLDYPVSYDSLIYRYADFNAGHYASRNAAFQSAVGMASGIPLELDGDLVAYDRDASQGPGSTELAIRTLAKRLDIDDAAIRRALEQGQTQGFERTTLYERVYELADRTAHRPLPRALLPQIALHSPKITRHLTTEWFARRVHERHQRCLTRATSDAA
ncbi:MAG: DUF1615 domain-containing protein [Pseudomonadota bacterium]|nr:DUF1615 domain-containing protein [Pseudomonadota bacterium]